MRILIIGATGTIGKEVVSALSEGNEIISVTRKDSKVTADITKRSSLEAMYRAVGQVDAIVCSAGSGAWKPLDQLSDEDFDSSLHNKLMGQVNVIRLGFANVKDGGSITVTSGVLSKSPTVGSGAISLVNSGLEGFVRAAALEAPRGIRVNVVSPPWVSETLSAMKMDPAHGLPSATVAKAYVSSVQGKDTGKVIEP
jgi:NAD(P)-dependent dehydrogenase (short-subunit alcohol dehydrogenase family)